MFAVVWVANPRSFIHLTFTIHYTTTIYTINRRDMFCINNFIYSNFSHTMAKHKNSITHNIHTIPCATYIIMLSEKIYSNLFIYSKILIYVVCTMTGWIEWLEWSVSVTVLYASASFGTSWVRSGRHIRISEDTSRFIMLHTTV